MMKQSRSVVKALVCFMVLFGLGFLIGALVQNERHKKENYELYERLDSLARLSYYRDESSLPYLNVSKDSVLRMLPPETKRFDILCIYDGAEIGLSHGAYNFFVDKVKNTKDTVYVQEYYWDVPFSNMSKLYIVFELQKDSIWVAKSCAQWDTNMVNLD